VIPKPTGFSPAGQLAPIAPSNIAQVWANEGGDKVTRDELRATGDPNAVHNSVWDGTIISLSLKSENMEKILWKNAAHLLLGE
jgi:hypothetical protein